MTMVHGGDFASRHAKWRTKIEFSAKNLADAFDSPHRGGNRGKPKNSKKDRIQGFRLSFKHLPVDIDMGE